MDQIKIGKFIAKCRKANKITQSELAEKLGVTDRAISNWENGKNLPDVSFFKPLCNELNITINDLLSGEKVEKNSYQEKLEENVFSVISNVNTKITRIRRTIIVLVSIISPYPLTIFTGNENNLLVDLRINCPRVACLSAPNIILLFFLSLTAITIVISPLHSIFIVLVNKTFTYITIKINSFAFFITNIFFIVDTICTFHIFLLFYCSNNFFCLFHITFVYM